MVFNHLMETWRTAREERIFFTCCKQQNSLPCFSWSIWHICLFEKDTNLLLGGIVRGEDHKCESYQMYGCRDNQNGLEELT